MFVNKEISKHKSKRVLFLLISLFVILPIGAPYTITEAADSCAYNASGGKYCMLAPLGGFVGDNGVIDMSQGNALGTYLNTLYKMGIIVATLLAVIMITFGGLKYASTDAIGGKSEGKEMIRQALLGLLLAFMSYLILYQINPKLLNSDLNIQKTGTVNGNIEDGASDLIKSGSVEIAPSAGDGQHGSLYTSLGTDYGREESINDPAYILGYQDTGDGIYLEDGIYSKSGTATHFGYKDSEDNGMGSPVLNPNLTYGPVRQSNGTYKNEPLGIITNDLYIQGVALPQSVVRSVLGITGNSYSAYAPARKAGVLVQNRSGKQIIVPIVDFGPGSGPQSRGVVIDETEYVSRYLGGDGYRQYSIIPNYYPDR
jgi:hypothetical protein